MQLLIWRTLVQFAIVKSLIPVEVSTECVSKCMKTDSSMINLHVVPHSHMDLSWTATFEEYYFGTGQGKAKVQATFDSVVKALDEKESRTFIFVETAFIWMWFRLRSETMRNKFINLVKNGQIEIVSGGWSMNDEACTNYQSIIDQMTFGHRELERLVGECSRPRIGWQIDPFGHSREYANLVSQMQFDALILSRIHYESLSSMAAQSRMHLKWKTSDDLPRHMFAVLLTMMYGYDTPHALKLEETDYDSAVFDEQSPDYNAEQYIQSALMLAGELSSIYNTSNILLPIGGDFAFTRARPIFNFYDSLMGKINSINGSSIRMMYSTPSCYIQNLRREEYIPTRDKTGDFFPYISSSRDIWTGYFTSRQPTKLAERIGNNVLQSCKQLQVLADLHSGRDDAKVHHLKRVMGLLQHHDAVTGTSRQFVDEDYHFKTSNAIKDCLDVAEDSLWKLLEPLDESIMYRCDRLNESMCESIADIPQFTLVIHNPLAWTVRNHIVKIPRSNPLIRVTDAEGRQIRGQMIPIFERFFSGEMFEARVSHEFVFRVVKLPPMSLSVFNFQSAARYRSPNATTATKSFVVRSKTSSVIFNKHGQVMKVRLADKSVVELRQTFALYEGSRETTLQYPEYEYNTNSYLFYPPGSAQELNSFALAEIIKGDHYTEIRRQITEQISQCIRINHFDDLMEFEYRVATTDDSQVEQIVARYSSNLHSNATFYTDSNGRQLMKRVRNEYPDEQSAYTVDDVSSNYYPVSSRIIVRDEERDIQMTVFTDRSQGGTSLRDGEIELMIHSKSQQIDHLGLGEPLVDKVNGRKVFIRGKHKLLIARTSQSTVHRQLAINLQQPPVYYFVSGKMRVNQVNMGPELPPNIRLLTFEAVNNRSTLVRLEHIYQKDDLVEEAKPTRIDLKQAFESIGTIERLKEVTLSGYDVQPGETLSDDDSTSVTLEPMMIKSFIVDFSSLFFEQ